MFLMSSCRCFPNGASHFICYARDNAISYVAMSCTYALMSWSKELYQKNVQSQNVRCNDRLKRMFKDRERAPDKLGEGRCAPIVRMSIRHYSVNRTDEISHGAAKVRCRWKKPRRHGELGMRREFRPILFSARLAKQALRRAARPARYCQTSKTAGSSRLVDRSSAGMIWRGGAVRAFNGQEPMLRSSASRVASPKSFISKLYVSRGHGSVSRPARRRRGRCCRWRGKSAASLLASLRRG